MTAVLAPAPCRFVVPGQLPEDIHLLGDHAALRAQAQAALARRTAAYPALVSAGKMPEAEAATDISAWQAITAEWDWICTAAGAAPPSWTLHDRIDAVELAIERTSAALASAPARSRDELRHQRDCYRAMHYHLALAQHGGQRSQFYAGLNHQLRARASAAALPSYSPVCATCERRREDPATIGCTQTNWGLQQKDAA